MILNHLAISWSISSSEVIITKSLLVYFYPGVLFDKSIKVSNRDEKIKFYEQQKLSIVPETFCYGLPQEVVQYMTYIKSMQTNQTNEKIDYDYLRKLFRNLFNKHATMDGFQYDWVRHFLLKNLMMFFRLVKQ